MKAKKYQLSWSPARDLQDLNRKLAVQLRHIDEMLEGIYDNAIQVREGNWTPTDYSGAGLTFTNAVGKYIRLGPLVVATGTVTYPTTANTNAAILTGLPFSVDLTTANLERYGTLIVTTDESTLLRLMVGTDGNLNARTSTNTNVTNATLSTNVIYFTVIYRTSDD